MVATSLARTYALGIGIAYEMRATSWKPVSKVTIKVRLKQPSPSFRKTPISSVWQCSAFNSDSSKESGDVEDAPTLSEAKGVMSKSGYD